MTIGKTDKLAIQWGKCVAPYWRQLLIIYRGRIWWTHRFRKIW